MDIKFIRNKIQFGDYDLSEHAHKERQEEQITVEEVVTNYRPKKPVWIDWKTRSEELKSRA